MDQNKNQEPEQTTDVVSEQNTPDSSSRDVTSRRESRPRGGGKRVKKRSGCFSKFILLLSLLLIAAAAVIVVRDILPMARQMWAERSSSQTGEANQGKLPKEILLPEEEIRFDKADATQQLTPTLTPKDADAPLTWISSDPEVVSVSDSGLLTAVGTGTATITATAGEVTSNECSVVCDWKEETASGKLSLNHDDFTMSRAGETVSMKVISTEKADQDLKAVWKSKDDAVATISEDGVVTAVAKGTTEVSATVAGKTIVCVVRCNF